MHAVFGRFLAFRLAFFDVTRDIKGELKNRTFSFEAPNQFNPGELLQCRYKCGQIEIDYQGTPLW